MVVDILWEYALIIIYTLRGQRLRFSERLKVERE
jgi:hypothetical protein